MKKLILAVITLAAVGLTGQAQSTIKLHEESDGRYTMDASVAGVGVKTYYTDEDWYASMSTTTYLFLYENGYIAPADVNGMTTTKMPGGTSTKAGSFVIRNLKIGKIVVQNLPAFVIAKQSVPLLVGKKAFDCFGEVTRDGSLLTIDDRFEDEIAATVSPSTAAETATAAAKAGDKAKSAAGSKSTTVPGESDINSLIAEAQAHLDAKEYEAAAECFDILNDEGVLTMYGEYQYAMVLGILKRNDECIALIDKWLETNTGKSLTLDYWMYDTLGDSYARKGDREKAIEHYEEAVDAYCRMFNTTEKEIKRSVFKDETLGHTLYNLALQYSKINIGKTEYYAALAAKSGNASAKEYCDKCHLKY